jgi:hypothetical protein
MTAGFAGGLIDPAKRGGDIPFFLAVFFAFC